MLNFGRLCILLMGPIGFTLTMACSMAILYFTILAWLFQCCVRNVILVPILESIVSIQQILRSVGGGRTVLMSCFQRSAACGDDIRRSLC